MLEEVALRSEPEVRAAALLRLARVEGRLSLFDAALEEIRGFDEPRRGWLFEIARSVAAAIAPERIAGISQATRLRLHHDADMLVRIMVEHGQVEAAVRYALYAGGEFPMGMVATLLQSAREDSTRVALLRAAAEAWRTAVDDSFHSNVFAGVFARHWRYLPEPDARTLLHEIVDDAGRRPVQPISATYDPEGTVQVHTAHEHVFFLLLPPLRDLDPALTESLLSENPQLAAAARRFPRGMESVMEEANARRGISGGGYCMAGSPADFPYMESLIAAERGGSFDEPFRHALDKYSADVTNQAPKEFWRSTNAFRGILHRAGKRMGRAAEVYLDRIPDEALRLFAAIELEAALAGLPELSGVIIEQRRPGP